MNKSKSSVPASKPSEASTSSDPCNSLVALPDDSITAFTHLIAQGIQAWIEAGKMLLAMQREDKNVFQKIINRNQWLTVDILMTFTRIGRMELRPEVLLLNQTASNILMGLDFETQGRLIDKPIEVVVDITKRNEVIIQKKNVSDLSKDELRRLVHRGKINSTDEQAERLKVCRAAKTKPLGFIPDKAQERELVKLGCYRIIMRGGVPQLCKAAVTPFNAQRVLLADNMGDLDAFIELMRWSK